MPPDSSDGNLSPTSGSSPTISSLARAISSISRCDRSRYSRIGNWTFWRTVSEENSAPCWNSTPQRRSIARPLRSLAVAEVDAEHLDRAGALRHQADDGAHQHRLAGARAADEAEDLAATHVEREAVEHGARRRSRRRGRAPGSPPRLAGRHRLTSRSQAKNMAKKPSSTMTRKIDLTTEAVVCRPSDSALPSTSRPSTQATMPIISAMNGALIMPTAKWSSEIASRSRARKTSGLDAAIEPAHQAAAVERRHRAEEGEDRHRDDQRDDARQHQHLDRIEAHGAQRVDLLAHLHRAELGGVGAAGAAGDHDGDDQHAEFAQHQDADHVDDVDARRRTCGNGRCPAAR